MGVVFFILYTILRDAAREDSNSCKGDRRLRRKQGAEAGAAVAEGKPRPRGAARCGHRNPYSARRPASRRAKKPLRGFLGCGSANPPVGSGQCFLGTALFCLITKTAVPAAVTMPGAPGARNTKSHSPAQTRIGRYLYRAISSLPARAPCRKCEWPPVTAVRGILQGARSLRPGRRCWHCARRS